MTAAQDARRYAPSTQRNRAPIAAVLERILPRAGLVLEVASGTGEHAAFFARRFPGLVWLPSDPDAENRASIAAWCRAEGLANLRPPLALDAASDEWPIAGADALVCINMIHIAPWSAAEGLFRGGARILPAGAPLYLYGPYKRDGAHTAPSNAAFDDSLRARNPDWGVRDMSEVAALARGHGFDWDEVGAMPANNVSLIFRRRAAA